ncbi:MAG: hypothetical protein ACT4P5_11685, partial [Armatimonadota bacterium]
MRRVRVRVKKGRVVSPPDLPEDFEAELTLVDEAGGHGLLSETNRAYATLKADANAWKQEREERGLWDGTLADGLASPDKES